MEGRVILYDSDGVKIGETYQRRARQLVRQQRGMWVDERQEAMRFAPGMENLEPEADGDPSLVALAEKRLQAKRLFIWHSIALIPVALAILVFAAGFIDSLFGRFELGFFLGAGWGCWFTLYLIHGVVFAKSRGYRPFGSACKAKRHAERLAAEVEILRRSNA